MARTVWVSRIFSEAYSSLKTWGDKIAMDVEYRPGMERVIPLVDIGELTQAIGPSIKDPAP